MNIEETVQGLQQELRRGTLILLVLGQLRQETYGYSLVKKLNDSEIPMDPNTLYPLLRRLEGQGLLATEWDAGESKPRIYYDYILSEFKGGHVLTDFSYSAQESYFQGFGIVFPLILLVAPVIFPSFFLVCNIPVSRFIRESLFRNFTRRYIYG